MAYVYETPNEKTIASSATPGRIGRPGKWPSKYALPGVTVLTRAAPRLPRRRTAG